MADQTNPQTRRRKTQRPGDRPGADRRSRPGLHWTLIAGVLCFLGKNVDATAAAKAKAPSFACFSSQMQDALGGGPYYEKPVWNLHDSLKLPQWLMLTVDQRTRYEVMDGRFRANARGGDQRIAMENCVWLQASFESFRFGVEFLDSRQYAGDEGSTVNNTHANELDFLQAYAAFAQRNFLDSGIGTEVILGRQTMNMGSRRLVARNVFRNTINAFTGARIRLRDENGKWQFNGFVTMPVGRFPKDKTAILDGDHEWDEEEYKTWFSGGFLELYNLAFGVNGEIYLYHLDEGDRGKTQTRNRRLFTPGVRFYRKPAVGAFDFQFETVGQLGTSRATTSSADTEDLDHEAWFQHVSVGYTFDAPWTPRLSLHYDYASGDEDPNDRKMQRFDTLFGARRFEYNPTGIYGAFARSNINSPGYRITVSPRQNVKAFFSHRAFWLAEPKDVWTTSGLIDPTGKSGAYVGHQMEISARWDINASFNVEGGWAHLFKGDFAKKAPHAPDTQDVDYFYLQSLFRF